MSFDDEGNTFNNKSYWKRNIV